MNATEALGSDTFASETWGRSCYVGSYTIAVGRNGRLADIFWSSGRVVAQRPASILKLIVRPGFAEVVRVLIDGPGRS